MEGAVEVPSYFVCPISLEMMRDPVTLPTGITYDRDSIEKWIFSGDHLVCPVTKQPLATDRMEVMITPNHTLRRLIQAWCVANASRGVERFPTPRPPVDCAQIAALLDEIMLPSMQAAALRKLKALASESDRNRRCIEASGAVQVLACLLEKSIYEGAVEEEIVEEDAASGGATDQALAILNSLQLSEKSLLGLAQRDGADIVDLLTKALRRSSYRSRSHALQLLKSLLSVVAPPRLLFLKTEFFNELVGALRDRISYQVTSAALRVIILVCAWGKNASRAAQAGAVGALVELLLDEPERRICEMALVALDRLCACTRGRAELVAHAAGIAIVSKKIHRVSPLASKTAVKILHSVAVSPPSPRAAREMLELGVVTKLCCLLKMECDAKMRDMVREILKLHSNTWRSSPCLPPQFLEANSTQGHFLGNHI